MATPYQFKKVEFPEISHGISCKFVKKPQAIRGFFTPTLYKKANTVPTPKTKVSKVEIQIKNRYSTPENHKKFETSLARRHRLRTFRLRSLSRGRPQKPLIDPLSDSLMLLKAVLNRSPRRVPAVPEISVDAAGEEFFEEEGTRLKPRY